jgi:type II secretory pathway pseudopilin PulG
VRRVAAFSLLELVLAAAILATLVVAAFDLLSMQRREVFGSERSLLLHARALQRLAEEESRLNVLRFASPPDGTATVLQGLGATETVSAAPVPDTTGLWSLEVKLEYADGPASATRTIAVTRLVVDRDGLTRLPATVRSAP